MQALWSNILQRSSTCKSSFSKGAASAGQQDFSAPPASSELCNDLQSKQKKTEMTGALSELRSLENGGYQSGVSLKITVG